MGLIRIMVRIIHYKYRQKSVLNNIVFHHIEIGFCSNSIGEQYLDHNYFV